MPNEWIIILSNKEEHDEEIIKLNDPLGSYFRYVDDTIYIIFYIINSKFLAELI